LDAIFPRLALPKHPRDQTPPRATLNQRDAPFHQLVPSRLKKTDRHSQKPIDRQDRFPLAQRLSG